MDPYTAIEQRYNFSIPASYRLLEARGHFDYKRGEDNYLAFDDCEWLSPEAIAKHEFNRWEIAIDGGFVPFAMNGRGEPYCWRLDWAADGGEPAIVHCERCEWAICLAPSFSGMLYRFAIEAFGGRNCIPEHAKYKDKLYRDVDILSEVLPPDWMARLRELRRMPWRKDDKLNHALVISWQEAEELINADLAFPHLNEKFIHDKDYLERKKSM